MYAGKLVFAPSLNLVYPQRSNTLSRKRALVVTIVPDIYWILAQNCRHGNEPQEGAVETVGNGTRFLRPVFQARWERWKSRSLAFPRFPPRGSFHSAARSHPTSDLTRRHREILDIDQAGLFTDSRFQRRRDIGPTSILETPPVSCSTGTFPRNHGAARLHGMLFVSADAKPLPAHPDTPGSNATANGR